MLIQSPALRGMSRWCRAVAVLLVVSKLGILAAALAAGAEPQQVVELQLDTASQEVRLRPGWNAVFVRVDATLEDRIALLSAARVGAIAARSAVDEIIDEVANTELSGSEWFNSNLWDLQKVDPTDTQAIAFAARALSPGRCLLVLAGSDKEVSGTLSGAPSVRRQVWRGSAGTLFGPAVWEGDSAETLATYFATSPIAEGGLFHQLTAVDGWRGVSDPASHEIAPSECYFVQTSRYTDFQSSIDASVVGLDALEFRPGSTRRLLRLQNRTADPVAFTLSTAGFPDEGGAEPRPALFAWNAETSALEGASPEPLAADLSWEPLTASAGASLVVPARGHLDVRLGANMAAAAQWSRAGGANGPARIASVLRIASGGATILLPVSIEVPGGQSDLAGLWVGDAFVTRVGRKGGGVESLEPVTQPYPMRVILVRDRDGVCHLMSDVIELTGGTDGRRLLAIGEAEAREFMEGGALPLRRFRSAAYFLHEPVPQSPVSEPGRSTCLEPGSAATFRFVLAHNDPVNPDLHVTHPDHDGLDERYETYLQAGVEARTFQRELRLIVGDSGDARHFRADWSEFEVTGVMSETIEGVAAEAIETSGAFILRRMSEATLRETTGE